VHSVLTSLAKFSLRWRTMFGGIFGKKQASLEPKISSPMNTSSDTQASTETIQVYDNFGRELTMSKENWRTKVLPGTIQSAWSDPDRLYGLVVSALNDGFFPEALAAARRVAELEPANPRSACVYGIALMKNGQPEEAEQFLTSYIKINGEEGSVLTNLAKAQADCGNEALSGKTLWHALEVDPNQDNGLGWYWALVRERDGDAAGVDALRHVANLAGSWRAQLWLARLALQSGNAPEAFDLYEQSLGKMLTPTPADALMQISGDLGNAGRLSDLLALCLPRFDPAVHGLMVGNNLIKASIETGNLEQADKILQQLNRIQRPDWQQTLSYWDTELARARVATSSAPTSLDMTLLTIEGPVWAGPTSPASKIFPDRPTGPIIYLLGASAEGANNATEPTRQLSDGPGRAGRSIPLYFAEQLCIRSDARVQTLVPWIANGGGFILSGQPWGDQKAAEYARKGASECDWVITFHLRCGEAPWTLDVRLIRASNGACAESTTAKFNPNDSSDLIALSARLLLWIAQHAGATVKDSFEPYSTPAPAHFANYLLRLEQLLTLRCAAMDGAKNFIHGVREIIQGEIDLCLREPESVNARIILAQSLFYLRKIEPPILLEVAARVRLLQREKPLGRVAQEALDASIENSLGQSSSP
jgi:Flp pilus assembly protein TadD